MSWVAMPLMLAVVTGVARALARWRLMVVTVAGTSMIPTYQPGDRVLVLRTSRVHRGRVVVARPPRPPGSMVIHHPESSLPPPPPEAELLAAARRPLPPTATFDGASGMVIKRVVAVPGDAVPRSVRAVVADATVPAGKLVLIGDGQVSADSRVWGLLPIDDVLGIVIARTHRDPPGMPRRDVHVSTEGTG